MTVQYAPAPRPRGRMLRYLAPAVLAVLVAAVAAVVLSPPLRVGPHSSVVRSQGAGRTLPPYWIVRVGDTLSGISIKTRLSIAQLEAFNPNVDPNSLSPGQRLNLWRHPPAPPAPRPKPPGPMFWSVRPGQSFGSIAAKTGINIDTLQQLNPRLKPATLQPGDRVRLRR